MLIVLRDGFVFATHNDSQQADIVDLYDPSMEIIKASCSPKLDSFDPRLEGITATVVRAASTEA